MKAFLLLIFFSLPLQLLAETSFLNSRFLPRLYLESRYDTNDHESILGSELLLLDGGHAQKVIGLQQLEIQQADLEKQISSNELFQSYLVDLVDLEQVKIQIEIIESKFAAMESIEKSLIRKIGSGVDSSSGLKLLKLKVNILKRNDELLQEKKKFLEQLLGKNVFFNSNDMKNYAEILKSIDVEKGNLNSKQAMLQIQLQKTSLEASRPFYNLNPQLFTFAEYSQGEESEGRIGLKFNLSFGGEDFIARSIETQKGMIEKERNRFIYQREFSINELKSSFFNHKKEILKNQILEFEQKMAESVKLEKFLFDEYNRGVRDSDQVLEVWELVEQENERIGNELRDLITSII